MGELFAKNMARTTRRQVDGRHLLFGVKNICGAAEHPLTPKLADYALSKMNTSMEVTMF